MGRNPTDVFVQDDLKFPILQLLSLVDESLQLLQSPRTGLQDLSSKDGVVCGRKEEVGRYRCEILLVRKIAAWWMTAPPQAHLFPIAFTYCCPPNNTSTAQWDLFTTIISFRHFRTVLDLSMGGQSREGNKTSPATSGLRSQV